MHKLLSLLALVPILLDNVETWFNNFWRMHTFHIVLWLPAVTLLAYKVAALERTFIPNSANLSTRSKVSDAKIES